MLNEIYIISIILSKRYQFKNKEKVAIQEIGPRFTLKLRWLQSGTFDTKYGELEWLLKVMLMTNSQRLTFKLIQFINNYFAAT